MNKSTIARAFGAVAESYGVQAKLQKQVAEELFRRAKQCFGKGLVLDLGAGTGFLAELAKERLNEEIISLDIAENMCRKTSGISLCADIEALPFADGVIGGIISSLALQWLANPHTAFAESNRVLQKGGRLAFATFGPRTLAELRESFEKSGKKPPVLEFPSSLKLAAMLDESGFKQISIAPEIITRNYTDFRSLMVSIKSIGASYRRGGGLAGKGYFKAPAAYYESRFSGARGIKASWEVLYVTATK